MRGGDAGLGEEVEDVPALLPERGGHGQDSLKEAAAVGAMSSEASLPIEHSGSNGPLGRVVGWLDAVHTDEGPERRGDLEDHLAHALGLGLAATGPLPGDGIREETDVVMPAEAAKGTVTADGGPSGGAASLLCGLCLLRGLSSYGSSAV